MKSNKIHIKQFADYILSKPCLHYHFEFDKDVFDTFIVDCFPETWEYTPDKRSVRVNLRLQSFFSYRLNLYTSLMWWFGVDDLHFKQLFRAGKAYSMNERKKVIEECEKGWSSVELSATMNSHEFAKELLKYYEWYQTLKDVKTNE